MTYQVLARKWRPQDFSSIVGQEPIVTALRNGLRENRIAHAYLFSGIRGVGKTTAARVLSKALNCDRGTPAGQPADNPCNECRPCIDITAGKDLDVLEVDAATYSKVEQVRELTENLRYGPARDRYKVVVLDEVHRLSRQAFDALLKIVEEPPPHLIFVFATTESDAVPATVLSRCQEFHFRRVSSALMVDYLRHISQEEGIKVTDKGLRLIARVGEGSVRDSVALLDQLATFGNSEISDDDAANLLGGLDASIFHGLLRAILQGDHLAVAETVSEIESNGWDPHSVYGQFLTYSKDAMHLALGGNPDLLDLPAEETRALKDLIQPYGHRALLRLTQLLLTSEETVRRSEFSLIALNLAWLRAAELPTLIRIQSFLSGNSELPTNKPKPPNNPSPETARKSASEQTPRTEATDQPKVVATAKNNLPGDETRMRSFLALISERRQPLAALLESVDLNYDSNQLEIRPQQGDALLGAALQRKNNATLFDELLKQVWGQEATWVIKEPTPNPKVNTEHCSPSNRSNEDIESDPTVNVVLDIFGGKIQSVQ